MLIEFDDIELANLRDCLECVTKLNYDPIINNKAGELKNRISNLLEEEILRNNYFSEIADYLDEIPALPIIIPGVPADFKLVEDCQVNSINAL